MKESSQKNPSPSFPFETKLSFGPLIRKLEERDWKVAFGEELQTYLQKYPELAEPITDLSILKKHAGFVEQLMSNVFSTIIEGESRLFVAGVPYKQKAIYGSPEFKKYFQGFDLRKLIVKTKNWGLDIVEQGITANALFRILKKYYNSPYKISIRGGLLQSLDPVTGLSKYFKPVPFQDLVDITHTGELPVLSEEELLDLSYNFNDNRFWSKYINAKNFQFHGVVILVFIEVTAEVALNDIQHFLLKEKSLSQKGAIQKLQENLRILFNIPGLMVGLSIFYNQQFSLVRTRNLKELSLMVDGLEEEVDYEIFLGPYYQTLFLDKKPVFLNRIKSIENPVGCLKKMQEIGVDELVLYPITYGESIVGILELATPNYTNLKINSYMDIYDLLPPLTAGLVRHINDVERHLQAIIRANFTAVHPVVEWKFMEEAFKIFESEIKNQAIDIQNIRFEKVYPLYSASDIRGSSNLQNQALQEDLLTQLDLVHEILQTAIDIQDSAVIEEIKFVVQEKQMLLKEGLNSGDEAVILEYLNHEITPCFQFIQKEYDSEKVQRKLSEYWKRLGGQNNLLYEKRKAFEKSTLLLNDTLAFSVDQAQLQAQKIFPHYFEKYITDGLEFNIYIGASLAPKRSFSPMHLKDLKIWQLMCIVNIARETEAIKPQLEIPLELTHLILVYSRPISIKFNMDEKQFGVTGSSNIRYEIIKKRIDKAVIKGSGERLTQPGKLAIVFFRNTDEEEYLRYIQYLTKKDYFTEEIENVEIQDLQGVSGLKAIRVGINFLNKIK